MEWWVILLLTCGILSAISGLLFLLKWYLRKAAYAKPTKISNKVVIITGANTGIGKANAIDLARRGGKIYIACRDTKKGEEAVKEIKDISGSNEVFFLQLDLASMKSIREFSRKFHEVESNLHILICNAGVMGCPKSFTKDGFELQLGVNHLGHFLLTNLLLDMLEAASPSRIVIVSSMGHKFGKINKKDLMGEIGYHKFFAYCQSKLANVLFANELSRRLDGTGITVNSCHPGVVRTELTRHSKVNEYFMQIFNPWMKTPLEGAQTQIRLAVDPELQYVTGKYFENCKESEASRAAQNVETAAWLYGKSLELVEL